MNVIKVTNENELMDAYSVRKEVFVVEQKVPLEEEIDQHEEEAAHFVLYDGNIPVGAGRFRIVEGKGKVERICVLSSSRKKGAGQLIMQAIEDYAHSQDIHTLKLNAQTHAIPFYEILGYSVVSDEFLDAGIPHKTMEKSI
ncbi:GNAT family N-acetyltransferase [Heyndrickxia acidicola]|uniref:GNAT family N-acetyltransferase n=1 Tax=Heyndrickxia acidicola TaxID=209389 RepID=A0ABU6MGZ6_9BACI|nr:GNAT family N-acetyltransferase [Heyndrickxia acidicola]MED1202547.1 GNAT family N-acetyltransferase [Heyndrickxia acidicola]